TRHSPKFQRRLYGVPPAVREGGLGAFLLPAPMAARGPDPRAILSKRRGVGGAPTGPRVRPAGSPGVLGASRQLSGRGRLPRLRLKSERFLACRICITGR